MSTITDICYILCMYKLASECIASECIKCCCKNNDHRSYFIPPSESGCKDGKYCKNTNRDIDIEANIVIYQE